MNTSQFEVTLVDSMGSDLAVVNAARVSFNKKSEYETIEVGYDEDCNPGEPHTVKRLNDKDKKLIKYLAQHGHWTPFSQVQYQVRIKAPIFVARQWFKHMVGITRNEVSRRYVDSTPEFYEPTTWRAKPTDGAKQGSSGAAESQYFPNKYLKDIHENAIMCYEKMLAQGVCPEQARMILPQSMMTEWVETGSLAAAARIYKQRTDNHAQVEIQELAKMFGDCLEDIAPISWEYLI